MKILFRVDAGGEVGLGHYYRSIALANKLAEKGHKIYFVHMASRFWSNEKSNNIPFQTFEVNSLKHCNELSVIKEYSIDILYVDGIIEYNKQYMNQIKSYVKIVFYQNLSNSRSFSDIFILPSIHQKKEFFLDFGKRTQVYQGLKYFTFHDKVTSLKKKRILVKLKI